MTILANEYIGKTLNFCDEIVGSTLGPHGTTVLLQTVVGNKRGVIPTKDGRTILDSLTGKYVLPDNPEEAEMILGLVRDIAKKIVQSAGDGTTTTLILAAALWREVQLSMEGRNRQQVIEGINEAVSYISRWIDGKAIMPDRTSLTGLAITSCNGDIELGTMIANLAWKVGRDGRIDIELSTSDKTTSEYRKGYNLPSSVFRYEFFNDPERNRAKHENPLVTIITEPIESFAQIEPIFSSWSKIQKWDDKEYPLVIFSNDITGSALSTVIYHSVNNKKRICICRLPSAEHGDQEFYIQDLREITGATVMSAQRGKSITQKNQVLFSESDFGTAETITADDNKTTIVPVKVISDQYIEKVREMVDREGQNGKYHKNRLSSLLSGHGILKLGSASGAENIYNYYLADDAVRACLSSLNYGIMPGAGKGYLAASQDKSKGHILAMQDTSDKGYGYRCVYNILKVPAIRLINSAFENANDPEQKAQVLAIHTNTTDWRSGYNFKTFAVTNLITEGIIDTAQATKGALVAASSLVNQFINSKYIFPL